MKRDLISISRGPQFRKGKTAYFVFVLVLFILMAVIFIIKKNFYPLIFLLPIMTLMFFFIIDICGVQIDLQRKELKQYRVNVWGKSGKWIDIKQYDLICLDYRRYRVKVASFYTHLTTTKRHRCNEEIHGDFEITLRNDENNDNIVIAQKAQYKIAKEAAKDLSNKMNIPFSDLYIKSVEESKLKRKN